MSKPRSLVLVWLACTVVVAEPSPRAWWRDAETQILALPCPVGRDAATAFDGELDDWTDLPAVPLGLARQTGYDRDWSGPGDLSATFRFAAGDDALMLAVAAADNTLIAAAGGDRLRGDQVRLYLGRGLEADPIEARCLVIVPARAGGTTLEPAEVLDGDTGDAVPGAVVVWRVIEGGYRIELRVPWTALPGDFAKPGDTRAVHVAVVDWDNGDGERGRLAWPTPFVETAPPAPPGQPGWKPPAVPLPERPRTFGRLDIVETFRAEAYLPTYMPLGVERNFYQDDEAVRVTALAGLGSDAAARLELFAFDRGAATTHLSRGADWADGAVRGVVWTWRTPLEFDQPLLLVGVLDELTEPAPRTYGRLESIGAAFRMHLERFAALRDRIHDAAVAPGTSVQMRRYLGSILINMEDKQSSHSAWLDYVVRDDIGRLIGDLDEFERLFATAREGRDPYGGRKGTYLRGYVSTMDDTIQHYSVAIPDKWVPDGTWPLVVNIHGYGFGQFLGHPAPGHGDAVSVACFGRGNGDYRLWCEDDILTVIDAMIEDYRVDPLRVYITGGSMGGTGSYHMAAQYPDRFAAIAPTCGNTNHRVWEEVWGWGQRTKTFLTPFRNWLENSTDSYQYAENLRHVPAYIVHGDRDDIVPVGHGRTMAERLKKLGYEVVYEEQAGVGHSGFSAGTGDRQKRYWMQFRRDPYPKRVTWKSSWHRMDGAYWVYLERFRRLAEDAQIDAEVRGQTVTVRTSNVERFRLELNEHLLDLAAPITVTVDDMPAFDGLPPPGGVLRLGLGGVRFRPVEEPRGLEKTPRIGGPIEHAFMSRFLLVCGTSGDRRTNEVNRRMAVQAAEKWRRWGREQPARLKMDWEVTERDIAESNLVCYGGPDSNRLVARINRGLPVRIEDGAVVFGSERFEGDDVGLKVCYPNPLNPSRYVCVFAGVTWQGTCDINGRFGNWFDWGVYDDRNWFDFAVFDGLTQSPETFLRVGYFDQDWGLDDAYVISGDQTERAKVRPRQPPDPLAVLPDRDEVFLSELTPASVVMEKGVLAFDHSFGGYPITLGNQTFERGLGIHPQAELTFDIGGRFQTFEAWCGVDLEGAKSVSAAREDAERVAFQVYADGKLLADTGEMRWNSLPRHLVLHVAGVRELRLTARALDGRKWLYGNSDWALCRLSRQAEALPERRRAARAAERLRLDGEWFLDEFALGDGVARGAQFDSPGLVADRPMRVPGSVAAALEQTGVLPALYANDNLSRVDALAAREWWLYRRFDLPGSWAGRRLLLSLNGVCQVGDAWLNGEYLGTVGGPFERRDLDATAAARCGAGNLLAVRVLAGRAAWTGVQGWRVPDREEVIGYGIGYGLDGGPRAVPLGILGGAEIRAAGPVLLGAPVVAAEPLPGVAAPTSDTRVAGLLAATVPVTNLSNESLEAVLECRLHPLDDAAPELVATGSARLQPGETRAVRLESQVAGLRLWWPAGLGPAAVYQADVSATVGGVPADSREAWCGARSLALEPADGGVTMIANGYRLGLRIVEWMPPDRLLRWNEPAAEAILLAARDAGFTVIRPAARGGAPCEAFYALCDRLGFPVLLDLPLLGNVGRAPLEDVEAAVEGVVLTARSHPCLLGYVAGVDLPPDPATEERLQRAVALVAELDPARLLFEPTRTEPGLQTWRYAPAGAAERGLESFEVARIDLPAAGPRDLSFLDRSALGDNEAQAPWPLTGWWRFHGGADADLAAAEAWLGPLRGEAAQLAGLGRRQADEARRRLTMALAAGSTICVAALNESWPRIGSALLDFGGAPRPAYGTVQRLLAGPAVLAVGDRTAAAAGEMLAFDLFLRAGDDPVSWPAGRRPGPEVRSRVLGLDGRVYTESLWPLGDIPPAGRGVGSLLWEIDPAVRPGTYLLVSDVPGSELPSDIIPLAVTAQAAAPPVRLASQVSGRLLPGVADTDLAASPEAIWLGDGAPLSDADIQTALARVAAGAGLILDGPPDWITGTALEDLLPAVPALSPEGALGPAVSPVAAAPSHPVATALTGLPAGRPDALCTLAAGAEVIAWFGPERPFLVESAFGSGRVMMLQVPREYARVLRHWDGLDRLRAALVAYAAKLPHHLAQRLIDPPPGSDHSALMALPEAPLRIDFATAPLACDLDRPGEREVTVRNEGGTPALSVDLRVTGLPRDVTATLSRNGFALMPGESRRVVLTVRSYRRGAREAKAALEVSGWGARPARIEFVVEAGR